MKRGGGRGGGERVFPYFSLFKKETSLSPLQFRPQFRLFARTYGMWEEEIENRDLAALHIFSSPPFFATKVPLRTGPFPALFSPFNNIYFPPLLFVKRGKEEEIWRSSSWLVNAEFFLTGCPLSSPNSDTNTHLVLAENALRFFFFLSFSCVVTASNEALSKSFC